MLLDRDFHTLARLYRLSPAEAGISRNYLKRLFDKTDTPRQAALLAALFIGSGAAPRRRRSG